MQQSRIALITRLINRFLPMSYCTVQLSLLKTTSKMQPFSQLLLHSLLEKPSQHRMQCLLSAAQQGSSLHHGCLQLCRCQQLLLLCCIYQHQMQKSLTQ